MITADRLEKKERDRKKEDEKSDSEIQLTPVTSKETVQRQIAEKKKNPQSSSKKKKRNAREQNRAQHFPVCSSFYNPMTKLRRYKTMLLHSKIDTTAVKGRGMRRRRRSLKRTNKPKRKTFFKS
ncbi:hypothetical protein CEXT_114171 [Caerostris extrusa]|uniref:Uncharacterized protein n=1 Tax=Caerostris extrusa TaxID=172846 RepID=A0AAV4RYE0_CAEEX|nr:hypothetical protein CEXT_114171 [Caerostris extrusa]